MFNSVSFTFFNWSNYWTVLTNGWTDGQRNTALFIMITSTTLLLTIKWSHQQHWYSPSNEHINNTATHHQMITSTTLLLTIKWSHQQHCYSPSNDHINNTATHHQVITYQHCSCTIKCITSTTLLRTIKFISSTTLLLPIKCITSTTLLPIHQMHHIDNTATHHQMHHIINTATHHQLPYINTAILHTNIWPQRGVSSLIPKAGMLISSEAWRTSAWLSPTNLNRQNQSV